MEQEKNEPKGRERDEATVELLSKLREQLRSDDISKARMAAKRLSWMQDDGLEILKNALLGNFPRTTQKAAAYGLRSMRGRMTKIAIEVLKQGLNHRNHTTRSACEKSLSLMEGQTTEKAPTPKKPTSVRIEIRELRKQSRNTGSAREKTPPINKPNSSTS